MKFEVENFSSELEAELTVLQYVENDENLIEEYNLKIQAINQELNEIATSELKEPKEKIITEEMGEESGLIEEPQETVGIGLETFTIKELKEIADSNGLEYPSRILKADLIKLINDG
jgi:hypothetical protein